MVSISVHLKDNTKTGGGFIWKYAWFEYIIGLNFGIKINNNPKVIINMKYEKIIRETGFEPVSPETAVLKTAGITELTDSRETEIFTFLLLSPKKKQVTFTLYYNYSF